MSAPSSVDRLPQSSAGVPDSVTVIALSPIPDRSSYAVNSPHLGIIRERARPGGSPSRSTRTSDNASLLARLRSILSPPLESLLPGPQSVLQWPGELMPFQLDGVRALIGSERLLLADDMGLGKTLQVIAALRVLFVRRAIESALLVAPASILDQWRQELLKWAPELKAIIIRGTQMDRGWQWNAEVHVTIVSYETLRSDTGGAPITAA